MNRTRTQRKVGFQSALASSSLHSALQVQPRSSYIAKNQYRPLDQNQRDMDFDVQSQVSSSAAIRKERFKQSSDDKVQEIKSTLSFLKTSKVLSNVLSLRSISRIGGQHTLHTERIQEIDEGEDFYNPKGEHRNTFAQAHSATLPQHHGSTPTPPQPIDQDIDVNDHQVIPPSTKNLKQMLDLDDENDPDMVFGGSNQDDIDSDDDFLVEVNNLYDPDMPGPQELATEQE